MRQTPTQDLSDGELFYIIEYGVRFTGMAAYGDGSEVGEELGWKLVRFIRQLPKLTPEDLEEMKGAEPVAITRLVFLPQILHAKEAPGRNVRTARGAPRTRPSGSSRILGGDG